MKVLAQRKRKIGFLPQKTAFNLLMRLYAPKSDALTGKWNPPSAGHARAVTPQLERLIELRQPKLN